MRKRLIPLALAAGLQVLVWSMPATAREQPTAKPDAASTPAQTPPAKAPPTKPADKPHTVGEVVVTGEVAAVQSAIDRKSYSIASDLRVQSGGAIADALRNIPSVEVDLQGNVSLRGDPNVTILVDGKPSSLFEGDNKAQALQSMSADSVERVEVITNPSAEFRPDGTGGIINLVTKKAKGAGFTGSLRANAGDGDRYVVGLSAGYNSPRLTLTGDLGARQDTGKNHVVDDRLQRVTTAAPFQAADQHAITDLIADSVFGRGAVDYDLTPRLRVGAESHFNYSFFRVDNPTQFIEFGPTGAFLDSFERQLTVHQKRAAAEVSANLRQKLAGDGEFAMNLSAEEIDDPRVRFGHTFDIAPAAPDEVDEQRLNYHQHRYDLRGDLNQPFGDMSRLKAGFDIEEIDNSYRNRGFAGPSKAALAPDAALTNLFNFRQTVSAAYATYEKPMGQLTLLAGLRIEDVRIHLDQATLGQASEIDYLRLYPTLHLGWRLDDDQTLSASYSHRVQRPDPLQFNTFRFLVDPLNFRAGNAQLKPQQTQAYELGYERHAAGTLFQATLFYRQTRDGFSDVLVDLGDGVSLSEPANLARSSFAGVELVAAGKLIPTLSYNVSGVVQWKQVDSLGPLFAPTRSLIAESVRGSLTWQASRDDTFQLNGFVNQKGLIAQGVLEPVKGADLAYRRKITERLFALVTLNDVFNSFRGMMINTTPLLLERNKGVNDTRQARIGFTWAFGAGKPKDPGFDFQGGGGAGPTP